MSNKIKHRIYVVSQAKIKGKPLGFWIELDGKNEIQILSEIREKLKEAFTQRDGWNINGQDLQGVELQGDETIEDVLNILDALGEHGQGFIAGCFKFGWRKSLKYFELQGCYLGSFASKQEWARNFIKDLRAIDKQFAVLAKQLGFEKHVHNSEKLNGIEFAHYKSRVYVFQTL